MLVLVSGKAGSGKDTFADILVNNYGFTKLHFADALKDMCARIANIPREHFDDRTEKERSRPVDLFGVKRELSPRDVAIIVGCTAREVDQSVWCQKIEQVLEKNPNKKYVIADWRFDSEYDHFQRRGTLFRLGLRDLITIKLEREEALDLNNVAERGISNDFMFDVVVPASHNHNIDQLENFTACLDLITK